MKINNLKPMKKLILLFGLISATTFAQTDVATLNVRLHPIQTIAVNQKVVNVDYVTTTDYTNGVSLNQPNHLTVFSTGGFEVRVSSQDATLSNTINSETINASDVKITASEGSANALSGVVYESPVSLSTNPTLLFSKTTGGFNKNFNVNYNVIGDGGEYINKYFSAQSPTVYTTKVTYEITAK